MDNAQAGTAVERERQHHRLDGNYQHSSNVATQLQRSQATTLHTHTAHATKASSTLTTKPHPPTQPSPMTYSVAEWGVDGWLRSPSNRARAALPDASACVSLMWLIMEEAEAWASMRASAATFRLRALADMRRE